MEALEQRTVLSGTPVNLDLNSLGGSAPSDFVQLGNMWYFVATDNTHGRELWKTDGTEQGTEIVVDLHAGEESSFPYGLVNVDGTLFFAADNGTTGLELWKSDGTAAGTVLVKDIHAGNDSETNPNSSTPQNLTDVGGVLYFTANDGVTGVELWKSDGTSEGTVLVRDIFEGDQANSNDPNNSAPSDFVALGDTLIFTATDDQSGREIWKSDGTEAGTEIVRDIHTGTDNGGAPNDSFPGLLTLHNGEVYFVADDGVHGAELWKTDGTEQGTELVRDIQSGTEGAFTNADSMISNGSFLIFTADDGTTGNELWRSDGTEVGTTIIQDITAGAEGNLNSFASLTEFDGTVYFSADDGTTGKELWMTDGTTSGTVMIADISPGVTPDDQQVPYSSYPTNFQKIGDVVYFSAHTPKTGRELWSTDGTAEGTQIVEDSIKGTIGTDPDQLTNVNGNLLYTAAEGSGRELWTVADEDDILLTIVVDSQFITIPQDVGVKADGSTSALFTVSDTGQILFDPDAGATLGDFFDIWRTDAGVAGNNVDAILSSTELLGNTTNFENTLQMFVNGELTKEFDEYVLQDDDDIVLVFGSNTVVGFQTNYGPIVMELFDDETPLTVENFLNYVNDGDYIDSIFHRSATDFVIQGGGFSTDSTTFTDTSQFGQVDTDDPVQNEPGISNTRGTIALAKLGNSPNSGTSQFFFNLSDNSSNLDTQNGGFTVFGQALGMETVDAIAALPVNDENPSPFGQLPLGPANELVVVQGIDGYGDLTGVKYVDENENNVFDSGERPLEGITVFVDLNSNGIHDLGEDSAVTDSEGRYRIQVEPATYTLRAELSAGGTNSTVSSLTVAVEVGQELTGLDFGEQGVVAPTSIDLLSQRDTGVSDEDDLTSNNNASSETFLAFFVSGVTSSAEVRLYANGVLVGTQIATSDRALLITDEMTTISDGVVEFTATQFINGLESASSPVLSVEIDTTAPSAISSTAPELATVGQAFSYDAESADEGTSGFRYSLIDAPDGMTIDSTTGVVNWLPGAEDAVPQDFQVALTDIAGNAAVQRIELTVLTDFPALPDTFEVNEDTTLTVGAEQSILLNDGDNDSTVVTARLVEGPANGVLSLESDGTFVYTPNADFFGEDSFTYVGQNGTTETNVTKVTINVLATQDAPVGVADTYTINEDEVLSPSLDEGVLSNDTDVDGDDLTAIVASEPSNGTLVLNSDGTFTYTPNADFSGTDSFTYRVSDGTDTSSPVTVEITVNEVDDTPVAESDSYSVNADATLEVSAENGVLANDTDPDSSNLTAEVVTQPQNGTLTLQNDGSFSYTPDAGFSGDDTFTYRASDGNTTSTETTVTITVDSQDNSVSGFVFHDANNDGVRDVGETGIPGVLVTLSGVDSNDNSVVRTALTRSDGSYEFTELPSGDYELREQQPSALSDGLDSTTIPNATAEDDQILDIVLSGGVSHTENNFGEQSLQSGYYSIRWFFASSADPQDVFRIVVAAGEFNGGNVDLAQQILAAGDEDSGPGGNDTNSVPVATTDSYTTNEDNSLQVTASNGVLNNDTDDDGQSLSAVLVSGSSNGSVDLNSDGSFSYTPNPDFFGTDSFTYIAFDGQDNSLETEVTLTVEAVDDQAVVASDLYLTTRDVALNVSQENGVLSNDTDVDSTLTSIIVTEPDNGTVVLSSDGSFEYVPDSGFIGTDSFVYRATDGVVSSENVTVTIEVLEAQELFLDASSTNGAVAGSVALPSSLTAPVIYEIVDENLAEELRLVADDHLSGSSSAQVVLVEYFDLQCPACRLYHGILEELKQQFADDLLVVSRHLPLTSVHANALEAAIAAEAAGRQDSFDEMVSLLFERQDDWEDLADPTSLFESYASELGLDATQFASDMVDPALEARVQRDADVAGELGLSGVPSIFIDGVQTFATSSVEAAAEQVQTALDAKDDPLVIDRLTGEVILADASDLDLATTSSYELAIRITDLAGQSGVVDVVVNLGESATASVTVASALKALEDAESTLNTNDAWDSAFEETEEWLYAV